MILPLIKRRWSFLQWISLTFLMTVSFQVDSFAVPWSSSELHATSLRNYARCNFLNNQKDGYTKIFSHSSPTPGDETNDVRSYAAQQLQELQRGARENGHTDHLQPGTQEGFFVVQEYTINVNGFDLSSVESLMGGDKMERLQLTSHNVTLPVALLLMDPKRYPSLSRARKEIRQGLVVHLEVEGKGTVQRALVGDRVLLGMRVARQEAKATILRQTDLLEKDTNGTQMTNGSAFWSLAKPSFHLPVVYEDDHMAVVNKPAGVLVYAEGGKGRNNVRFTILHVLQPPSPGTREVLNRPEVVHRLDFVTSGLLVVGKTAPAVRHLSQQFEHRRVQKTYTAIVDGRPHQSTNQTKVMTIDEANKFGFRMNNGHSQILPHVSNVDPEEGGWRLVRSLQDDKEAVTLWRPLLVEKSPQAKDGFVTKVELKPKTGRYHQLRRHMAWNYKTPIAGDPVYGDRKERSDRSKKFHRGLLLCSNQITLEHPYYNTPQGRKEWNELSQKGALRDGDLFLDAKDGTIYITLSVDLPEKFEKFLRSQRRMAAFDS